MENIEAQQINAWLATLERVPLRDDPMFRLVWSNDQRELRKCTQRLFLGKTFIKEVTHTERVLKYPWLKDRWVFEMWFSPEVVLHDELPETNQGSYEPLYVFEGSKGATALQTQSTPEGIQQPSIVSKSTVTQYGVPISSCRRYLLPMLPLSSHIT